MGCLETELDRMLQSSKAKDQRITELERKTTEQEEEINQLRKEIADKDETISRLNARLDVLENRKKRKT